MKKTKKLRRNRENTKDKHKCDSPVLCKTNMKWIIQETYKMYEKVYK